MNDVITINPFVKDEKVLGDHLDEVLLILKDSVLNSVLRFLETVGVSCPDEKTYPNVQADKLNHALSYLFDRIGLLGHKHDVLIQKLLLLDWYSISPEVVETVVRLLCCLVSSQIVHLESVLVALVRKLVPKTVPLPSSINDEKFVFESARKTLLAVVAIVPTSLCKLSRVFSQCYPFMKRSEREIVQFVRNLIHLARVNTKLRPIVLEVVIEELTKIDTIVRRDDLTENTVDDNEEVFSMEQDTSDDARPTTSDEKDASCAEEATVEQAMGNKLDLCFELLFDYIHETCHSADGDVNWLEAKEVYKILLKIFEAKILPLHACCHSPFIMFYVCSLKRDLYLHFLDWLWRKFLDPNMPSVLRQTCAFYLSSLIARAAFISIEDARFCLDEWLQFLHNYLATQDSTLQSKTVHGAFYALCQGCFYLTAFRLSEFLTLPDGLKYLQTRNFEGLVKCTLNPLRFCLEQVAANFAAVANRYQFAYCYSILEHNRRQLAYACLESEATRVAHNPLECFFPFDPFLLKKSGRFIVDCYRVYAPCSEDSADLLEASDNEAFDDASASVSPRSYDLSKSSGGFKELLLNGTVASPGFKLG